MKKYQKTNYKKIKIKIQKKYLIMMKKILMNNNHQKNKFHQNNKKNYKKQVFFSKQYIYKNKKQLILQINILNKKHSIYNNKIKKIKLMK